MFSFHGIRYHPPTLSLLSVIINKSQLPTALTVSQVAMDHFLGKAGAYVTTVLICLVIAGSALGNSFVAGRMTVAAANKKWFPPIFGSVGQIGTFKVKKAAKGDAPATTEEAMDDGESPMYEYSFHHDCRFANEAIVMHSS